LEGLLYSPGDRDNISSVHGYCDHDIIALIYRGLHKSLIFTHSLIGVNKY